MTAKTFLQGRPGLGRSGFQVWGRHGWVWEGQGPWHQGGSDGLSASETGSARKWGPGQPPPHRTPSALVYPHCPLSTRNGVGAVTVVPRSPWPGRLSHGEQGISFADQQGIKLVKTCLLWARCPQRGPGQRRALPLQNWRWGFWAILQITLM